MLPGIRICRPVWSSNPPTRNAGSFEVGGCSVDEHRIMWNGRAVPSAESISAQFVGRAIRSASERCLRQVAAGRQRLGRCELPCGFPQLHSSSISSCSRTMESAKVLLRNEFGHPIPSGCAICKTLVDLGARSTLE